MPPATDRVRDRQGPVSRRGDGQVDILDRPAQREVRLVIGGFDLGQLGERGGCAQRAAVERGAERLAVDAERAGQRSGFRDALDEEGQPGVQDQLQFAALPGLAQPERGLPMAPNTGVSGDRAASGPEARMSS